jgi:outer membrane protein
MRAHLLRTACMFSVLLMFVLANTGFSQEMKLGKINLQEINKSSKRINAAFQEIRKIQTEEQTKLQGLIRDTSKIESRLSEDKSLTPQDKEKLQNELKEKNQELESEKQAAGVKMALKQKSMQNEIGVQLNGLIPKVAKEEGVTVVFRSEAIAYSEGLVDITEKVVKALDAIPSLESGPKGN